jgi:serine/threonine protein kinase
MEGEADTEDDEITGDTGTKSFLPPEVLLGKANIKGKAADIWATGVTFFFLSFGKMPFTGKNLQ